MPAQKIVGSLDQALTTLKNNPSDACQVYYLEESCDLPYAPTTDVNEQVTVGEMIATRVAVNDMVTASVSVMLVSDSFRPCVPVIAIGQENKSLAHVQGPGLAQRFVKSCQDNKFRTILVIKKNRIKRRL
jgi:hypothetical protein